MDKPPAQKGDEPRVRFNARIDIKTIEIIRRLAKLWGKSQGEVIDQLAKEQTPDD